MAAITDLAALTAIASGDLLVVHDISAATDKKITQADLLGGASTFTPTIKFGGASTGITYTTQIGHYSRIGNRIFFSVSIVLSSKGSATGTATVESLPFALSIGAVAYFGFWASMTTSILNLMGFHSSTTSAFTLYHLTAAGTSWTVSTDAIFANNSSLYMSGSYITS